MTARLRAVFDTNVFVSALISHNPTSPTRELLQRWRNDEFVLLVSQAILEEVVEKLREHGIEEEQIYELILTISRLAEWVDVPPETVQPMVTADLDDDQILACAVAGQAHFLVTYDPHFDPLHGVYQDIQITKSLSFLRIVRGDQPPDIANR